jgi:hypothetical protein
MTRLVLAVLTGWLVTGCAMEECSDCTSGPATPRVAITDDGAVLTITGCELVGFVGCTGSTETMIATLDGQSIAVPGVDDSSASYDHRIDLGSPAVPQIEIVDNSLSTGVLVELPAFGIDGASDVSRTTTTMVEIDFDVLPSTTASAVATSTCNGSPTGTQVTLISPGRAEVELDAVTGTCTHVIAVTQTATGMAGPIVTSIARIQSLSFTSEP